MNSRNNKKIKIILTLFFLLVTMNGCGNRETSLDKKDDAQTKERLQETIEEEQKEQPKTGLSYETAKDAEINFEILKKENPDIFAWIYIPGTDIDYPVLQSEESDDFYENHDANGKESADGAIYTELANLKDMCDFNTVLHGKTSKEGGLFSDLYRYSDMNFLTEHGEIYLYLEDNLLTYEIFAAYEREDNSLIRNYDFTYLSGCQQFLDDLYDARVMGKNIKEGWEDVTPYHFLITLTTQSEQNPGKQYVVVAALVSDAAGTIDRMVSE